MGDFKKKWAGHLVMALLLCVAMFQASFAVNLRAYNGTQVQNLIDTVNQHATMINQINGDLGYFAGKLNSDAGVTYTNFAATTSSTTVADSLRR